jgi:hypothetical protein
MNSHWIRGYGDPPPKTVIVVGMSREFVESAFESCQTAGHVSNRFGIENSVIRNTDIFLCHSLRQSWPLFWQGFQYYGYSVSMKAEMQRVQPSGCISLSAGGWSSEGYEATEGDSRQRRQATREQRDERRCGSLCSKQ